MPAHPARERLLAAAAVLFYNDGIGATGIDAITARAGVAKMSLYNNFANKAELVSAFLQARHAEWLALYQQRLALANGPKEGVLAVFDAYADHARFAYERGFRGCGLLNAAAELPVGDPGRALVRGHKEAVQGLLAGHLTALLEGDGQRVEALAEHLSLLLEGGMSRAGLEGTAHKVLAARALAAHLLEAL